ncbi:MAG TPA: apolipoprotein N-acyltransferase [Streptosporangiaceae bacterium]|nr:apolipoprotein N-acyltransferase [Streptosporangiaceae bacterium]
MGFWRGFAQPARYAALLAGGLPVLAFPAPNLEFVAWFGLLPGLFMLRAAPTGREAAIRGWWFGAGYLLAALYWLTPNLGPALLLVVIVLGAPWSGVGYAAWRLLRSRPRIADLPSATEPVEASAPAAVQTVATDLLSAPLPPAPANPTTPGSQATLARGATAATAQAPVTPPSFPRGRALLRSLAGPNGGPNGGPSTGQALAALVVLPSCWVVIDWLRSWHGIGGPWAVFGASQWQHPVVLALAAVGGVWLISFTLVAANTGLMIALTSARWLGRALGLVAAALAIAAGPTTFALTAADYAAPATRHVTLDLVQPGLWIGPTARLAAETRLTLASRASAPHGPTLIVWGESSVGYDLYTDHAVLRQLTRLSKRVGTQLLVSQDARSPSGVKSKVAVLIGAHGIEGTYVKTRLVPFGEYIPFRSVLGWLTQISRAAPTNMISGNGAHVLHAVLPGGQRLTFGVLICFESSFPDMSAVDTNHGAQVLIYQTSDSTFQDSWALPQHASLAAIRAAESGRPAVQAALTGDSAAFDSRGRLLGWQDSTQRGVLRITLPLPAKPVRTPFSRFGDYVPWFAIAVVAVFILGATGTVARVRRLMPD